VTPAASARVGSEARAHGVGYVCGKVAGSVGPATDGTLTLFASGEQAHFEACRPAFAAMASTVHHVGSGDAAAYLKLVHSMIVGVYSSMIGEALAFGQRGGLDLATIVDVLEAGPLGSRQLTLKAPVLKGRQFDGPPSDIDTAAKDVDMILDTARRDAMPLPVTSTVRQMMAAAQAHGGGKRDIYSILEAYERLGASGNRA
jgi:2-hydroxy-3-oxopropionate reductase